MNNNKKKVFLLGHFDLVPNSEKWQKITSVLRKLFLFIT